jgi:hypothetical protein
MMSKGPLEKRERLHRVCKSIIDNPRNVDAGSKAELVAATRRFVKSRYDDETEGLEALYHDDGELGSSLRKAVEIIDAADLDDDADRGGDTFEKIFTGKADGADIAKARTRHDVGGRGIAAAVSEHVLDMLDFHRRRLGLSKRVGQPEESNMRHTETLENIAKTHGVGGVVEIAKNITGEQRSFRITEEEFVKLIDTAARVAYPELGARAFERVYERNPVLAKAITVIKEMPFVADLTPLVVGGADTRDLSDQSTAIEQLKQLGARKWPSASEAAQFANAFTDPVNRELAARAHRRPSATTSYAFPR